MKILEHENSDDYICEVVGCGKRAEYLVADWDGEDGYICKECNDKDEREDIASINDQSSDSDSDMELFKRKPVLILSDSE